MNSIPLVRFNELPVSTSGLLDAHFVAVSGNLSTVRIPASSLYRGFVSKADSVSVGSDGDLYIGDDGVFANSQGTWLKLPTYAQDNWDDLESTTRFLRVDKAMSLTEAEVGNVRNAIGITTATQDGLGLVKGSDNVTIENGAVTVALATSTQPGLAKLADLYSTVGSWDNNTAVTPNFVQGCVRYLIQENSNKVASNTSIGVVMGGTELDSVNVDPVTGAMTVPMATVPGTKHPGLTFLAPGTREALESSDDSSAAPVSLVKEIAEYYASDYVKSARSAVNDQPSRLGTVTPEGNIQCSNDEFAYISVRSATHLLDGTVKVTPPNMSGTQSDMVTAHGDKAATVRGVALYVAQGNYTTPDSLSAHLASSAIASEARVGAIKASSTVRVNSSTGVASVPAATTSVAGVVRVRNYKSTSDTPTDVVSYEEYSTTAGPAKATVPGRVKVAGATSDDDYPTVVSYEDFLNRLYLYAASSTAGFIKAVEVNGAASVGICPTAITTDYWKSSYASTTQPGIVKVYGANGKETASVASLGTTMGSTMPVSGMYAFSVAANDSVELYFDCTGVQYRYPTVLYTMASGSKLTIHSGSMPARASVPPLEMIPKTVYSSLVGVNRSVKLTVIIRATSTVTLKLDGTWNKNDVGTNITLTAGMHIIDLRAFVVDSGVSYFMASKVSNINV